MSFSLEAIWDRVRAGDHRAWRELVEHFQPLVYSLAARSGLSSSEAADCFQHTWVALYEHRHRIKESQRLPGWIVTTVRREAFRFRKQQSRLLPDENLPESASVAPDPSQELELTERQYYLEAGLARLDPRCRRLLQALFYETDETTYVGLANELKLSINAIGPLRKRCLARLRELLVADGITDDSGSLSQPFRRRLLLSARNQLAGSLITKRTNDTGHKVPSRTSLSIAQVGKPRPKVKLKDNPT